MADSTIQFRFEGNAEQLLAEVKKITGSLKGLASDAQATSHTTGAAAVAMGNLYAEAAHKIMEWGKEAFGAFTSVAGEVRKLQRVLGGSAEDMSRLRFVGHELGVSVEGLSRSMAIAASHLAKNDDIAQKFGVTLTDAAGATKSSTQVLGELADRLNAIPDPLQRTAAAKAMFGRSFQEMLPLLMRGSEGIKEFGEEADKLGLTLTQKDLDASRKFSLQMKELKASVEGVFVSMGRVLMPVLGTFVKTASEAVESVRHLWETNSKFRDVLKVIAAIVGVIVAGILAYNAAVKVAAIVTAVWEKAQWLLDGALDANPIGLVVAAIVAFITIVVLLVKNFEPAGRAIIILGKTLGSVLGPAISYVIQGFRLLADLVMTVADKILMAAGWLGKFTDWIGLTDGAADMIEGWRSGMSEAKSIMDSTLTEWANKSYTEGERIGNELADGLVSAIKRLKLPSLTGGGAKGEGVAIPMDLTDGGAAGGGGGGKSAVDARKQAILDFFKKLVESSYTALDALKQAARDVKQKMADVGKQVADALNSAFSITDVAASSFANYLGADRLVAGFRKRLDDMKEFVTNLRALIAMGLPREMLVEIAAAGVSGGAATARMLVQHPEVMADLRNIQREINEQTVAAGTLVGEGVYGPELMAAEKAATDYQRVYARRLGQAKSMGYQPTAEQVAAATTNIHNEINMNNITTVSESQIESAVAWALKTGTALGMGGAPRTGGGGGTRPPATTPTYSYTPSQHTVVGRVGGGVEAR